MDHGMLDNSLLKSLFVVKDARSRRVSSWDRTGGNRDWISIGSNETAVLLEAGGPGCITHFYWTMIGNDPYDLRRAVVRMYWDGEETPSVEVPLGDFFGAANCVVPVFASQLMTINIGMGVSFGFNCYFPMPFSSGARIELHNDNDAGLGAPLNAYWYHIEYEEYDSHIPDSVGRFHAQWRRECLTQSANKDLTNVQLPWDKLNLSGDDNYVILEAQGQGQFVGLLLNVYNVAGGWWGEGDDMIFVDGEPFPPRYHGTGTEEIFGGGASPTRPYFGPYTGFSNVQHLDYSGNNTMYRWYIHDPIRFRESIRYSIEHGHANTFENDYSSVAYWYQIEPHAEFPRLLPAKERLPLVTEEFLEARSLLFRLIKLWFDFSAEISAEDRQFMRTAGSRAGEEFYAGKWGESLERMRELEPILRKYKR